MRQIPGQLYDLTQDVSTITPEMGRRWHLIQTLAGDQTDGYAGVPGIGIKRAEALFEKEGYTWETVVKAFADKDLDEAVALQNARLAKILQCTDYDFTNQEPRLWTPGSDSRNDNGATVQDETDRERTEAP
jgi:DNA polymerase-1